MGLINCKEVYQDTEGGRQKMKVYYFPVEPCLQMQAVSSFEASSLGVNPEAQHAPDEEPLVKAIENLCSV
ncbi:MAG TPA: hypothetical protein DCE56_17845 [Cyanobacteria bacterium UBA8553]|nr:hypothetical protein [Cyanobacteria bacterium UBA8553]HAJ58276.1 hypothetical protein [Cyanobacteria bacterium UBA8543]